VLEAVALIGRALAGGDALADLIQPPPRAPQGETTHLVKLDFRVSSASAPALRVGLKELDKRACADYCWLGNAPGNVPQFYLTTNTLRYLLGPAPASLRHRLAAAGLAGGALDRRLDALVQNFFSALPNGTLMFDPQRAGLVTEDVLTAVWQGAEGKSAKNREKAVLAAVAAAVEKWVLDQLDLKRTATGLWTLLVDGLPLAADPDYARVVLAARQGAAAPGESSGVCSVCGAAGRAVDAQFKVLQFLKYYVNDKLGAASGLTEKGFARNFQACPDCRQGLVLAERFVQDHLQLRVGRLNFLVLPAFLGETVLERADLELLVAEFKRRVGALADFTGWRQSLAGLENLNRELDNLLDELPHQDAVLLNFLFYERSQSEFRVLSLVKDVAPSRVVALLRASRRLAARAEVLLGPDRWWLDLSAVYRLIPLNERPRGAPKHKKLLHIYQSLLLRRPLARDSLVRHFVALARIYHTGNYTGTNVQPPPDGRAELEWTRRALQANLFLKLLGDENLLQGGVFLDHTVELASELLPSGMRDYLAEMRYGGPETALFLLGYLLQAVGSAQHGRGYQTKPILEKINYAGMSWPKVVRLANQLVDYLRQHDLFRYNEGLYAALKKMLDAHRPGTAGPEWPLTPEENVFFILSGYAYGTRMALKAGAAKRAAAANEDSPAVQDEPF